MQRGDLVSIGEAAKAIGVSVDTLRRWDKSGKLSSFRSEGRHRLYSKIQIELYLNEMVDLAKGWAFEGKKLSSEFYCPDSSVFQTMLNRMQVELSANKKLEKIFPLVGAVTGEIGINSFDHNIGNWPDIPGIFFGHDSDRKVVVLADKGQGILITLQRVLPSLHDDEQALRVAFSEIVSGRAPERRGNGLKFVREVISTNPMGLIFQSGEAVLTLTKGREELKIDRSPDNLKGCFALITF